MRLLLDTMAFLWATGAPGRLSTLATRLIRDPANQKLLSVASLWEIQIKCQIGKLTLEEPLADLLAREVEANGLVLLPIETAHVWELDRLPLIHRDPFDRILVAQTRVEGATLLSADPRIAAYPVPLAW